MQSVLPFGSLRRFRLAPAACAAASLLAFSAPAVQAIPLSPTITPTAASGSAGNGGMRRAGRVIPSGISPMEASQRVGGPRRPGMAQPDDQLPAGPDDRTQTAEKP